MKLRSRSLVPGSRPAVSTASRSFAASSAGPEVPTSSHRLGVPFRAYHPTTLEVLRGSDGLHGVLPPVRHPSENRKFPGFQLWPLPSPGPKSRRGRDSRTYRPEGRSRSGGRPFRAFPPHEALRLATLFPRAVSDIASFCSEDQRVTMPRGSRASCPVWIRSLHKTEVECGPMLSWVSCRFSGP